MSRANCPVCERDDVLVTVRGLYRRHHFGMDSKHFDICPMSGRWVSPFRYRVGS